MSEETEKTPATDDPEPATKGPELRTLPEIVEIFGSARDAHTRHLRRAARFGRRAFRIGGIYLIRPGRRFDMTLKVVRDHADEILERARAGQLQVRSHGKPFTIEELEHALLSEKAPYDPITEKLTAMADLATKLGSPPSEEALSEAIEEARGYEGEELDEFLAHLDTQLDEMRQVLAERGAGEEPSEGGETPEETSTEEEPPDGETTPNETPTEPAPPEEDGAPDTEIDAPENEEVEESAEDEEDSPQLVPADLRLPEGYERMKKDDLIDLFVEREDHGLALPEPKTEGKPPTNDQLVDALTEWALSVEFDDESEDSED